MLEDFWLPESVKREMAEREPDPDNPMLESMLLREYGIGTADLELARDDAGWMRFGAETGFPDITRIASVRRARAYYIRDPLSKQAIRVWTDYSIGRGIRWTAKDEVANDMLREFWDDKVNKPVLSSQGQHKSSDSLLVDGELFFIFFESAGDVKIRRIDPLEITEIITDPDDKETKKLYKRVWATPQNQQQEAYYPDWTNEKPADEWPDSLGGMKSATAEGSIYHIAFNSPGLRGISLLLAAMDWAKAHRKFLEARAAITEALSIFAWKGKVKGSSAQVNAMRNQMRSTLASGGSTETNPPPAPGSTWIENEGMDLQPVRTDSGARNAQVDGAMLLQMFGSAVGIFPHYFGAGESFRLATATAMERPMRVQFETYQELWGDIYDNIFNYVMEKNGVAKDKRFVDIDFPPIVEKEATDSIEAIVKILTVMPELGVDEIKKLILTNLGINNPDEVLEGISPIESASHKLTQGLKELRVAIEKEDGNGKVEGVFSLP